MTLQRFQKISGIVVCAGAGAGAGFLLTRALSGVPSVVCSCKTSFLPACFDELVADDSSGGFRDCRSYLGEAVRMHLPDRRNQVIRTACPNCSVGLLFARCQLSPNVLATYTRFAWLTGAVLARLTISLLALPFGAGEACRIESIRL